MKEESFKTFTRIKCTVHIFDLIIFNRCSINCPRMTTSFIFRLLSYGVYPSTGSGLKLIKVFLYQVPPPRPKLRRGRLVQRVTHCTGSPRLFGGILIVIVLYQTVHIVRNAWDYSNLTWDNSITSGDSSEFRVQSSEHG